MLTRDNAGGVFVGAPTPFTASGEIDHETFRMNIQRYVNAGIPGIWILGSSGQMQTVALNELEQLATALVEEAGGNAVTVVGCSAPSTAESIERARIASACGVDAVLNTLPYFVQLRKQEAYQYFSDLAEACPDIGIFHYNTARAGTLLDADDYVVLSEIPSFLGSKQIGTDAWHWMELRRKTPELAHWGVDGTMTLSAMFGCRGVWSAIAMWNPRFVLETMELCVSGDWDRAQDHQWQINAYLSEVAQPLVARGYLDPVVDKALSEICGFTEPGGLRRPFLPMPAEDWEWAAARIRERHGFLLEGRTTIG